VHARDRFFLRTRRFAAIEGAIFERIKNCLQTAGMFGVATGRFVTEHRRVREEQHAADVAPCAQKTKAAEGEQSPAAFLQDRILINRRELRGDEGGLVDGRKRDRSENRNGGK